jgi:hypothetical protein
MARKEGAADFPVRLAWRRNPDDAGSGHFVLNAPITASPVPRFPFTSIMTICTTGGQQRQRYHEALRCIRF